jgi:glycosyltransferase involved in cell wall biosynthesis
MDKLYIVIPAYNEQDSIMKTLADITQNAPNMDYIVINDCSTDSTKEILKNEGANFLDLPINLGIGGGVQTGYRYAQENNYDIAIQFDGDGQHCAAYLQDLIAPIVAGNADITIGSRFIRKEGFQSSGLRRFGINFLSCLIDILCGTKINDVTSGMRAVNKKMIAFFAREYAQDYPEPEAILSASLAGARIVEVPVQMRERSGGVSPINALKPIYYMVKVSISLIVSRLTYGRK